MTFVMPSSKVGVTWRNEHEWTRKTLCLVTLFVQYFKRVATFGYREWWGISKQSIVGVRCAGCISNWVSPPNMIASLNHARLSPSLHIFTFWETPSGFQPHSDGTSVLSELFQRFTANWNWKLHRIYWIYSNHHPLKVLCSHFPVPHPTGPPALQIVLPCHLSLSYW